MPTTIKTIDYKGTTIKIWQQSFQVGLSEVFWLKRPVEDRDVQAVKTIIDASRSGLARQLRALHEQENELLAS